MDFRNFLHTKTKKNCVSSECLKFHQEQIGALYLAQQQAIKSDEDCYFKEERAKGSSWNVMVPLTTPVECRIATFQIP